MFTYIISETFDGRFIVQRPNEMGGLYPLIPANEDCRSTVECFAAIARDSLESGDFYDGISIVYRRYGHPENTFNRD